MAPTSRTRKRLWGRSGRVCAYPECSQKLSVNGSGHSGTVIGQECHIVARSDDGPRGGQKPPGGDIDGYQNLVLMCANHHTLIDDNPEQYPVEKLLELKSNQEEWVESNLAEYDAEQQRDDEIYLDWLEHWEKKVNLENWDNWCSELVRPIPEIPKNRLNALEGITNWLFKRPWPSSRKDFETAMKNFGAVANDIARIVKRFKDQRVSEDSEVVILKQFPPEEFTGSTFMEKNAKAAEKTEYIFHLVNDLAFELTRAGNEICETVREAFLSDYRIKEGVLTLTEGPLHPDLSFRTVRPEYEQPISERDRYPGLKKFLSKRADRERYQDDTVKPELLGHLV